MKDDAPRQIRLHFHRVQHAVHFGEHHILAQQRRMHARLYALARLACDGEQLNRVAEFACVAKILRFQARYALAIHVGVAHARPKRQR